MNLVLAFLVVAVCGCMTAVMAGTKDKPHSHQGALRPYSGKHIPYKVTVAENERLEAGLPVTLNERNGKDGRGIVIQDVHALPDICMSRIKDLENYHKMVPKVNKVIIYDKLTHSNGTEQMAAEFNVGLSLLKFRYYLLLKFDPSVNTLTWTMDYKYSSDFDDTVGHWQVMQHPSKAGWSRVLYSTEVKLPPWVPEFVITFLTKTALVESTTWVRKESEKVAAAAALKTDTTSTAAETKYPQPDLTPCFVTDETGARYDTYCANGDEKQDSRSEL